MTKLSTIVRFDADTSEIENWGADASLADHAATDAAYADLETVCERFADLLAKAGLREPIKLYGACGGIYSVQLIYGVEPSGVAASAEAAVKGSRCTFELNPRRFDEESFEAPVREPAKVVAGGDDWVSF